MAKTNFVDGETVITTQIAQGWENVRWDLFNGASTKDGARSALGAVDANHSHQNAVPSINRLGGSPGFIAAVDLENVKRITAYPTSLSTSVPSNYTLAFIGPTGDIINIKFSDLTTILGGGGGGGGGGGVGTGVITGGEVEDTIAQVVSGGLASDTVANVISGGEAEDTVG